MRFDRSRDSILIVLLGALMAGMLVRGGVCFSDTWWMEKESGILGAVIRNDWYAP